MSESIFAVGTLSTGFAFVMLSVHPSPAAAWLVGLVGMLTICLHAGMWLYTRSTGGYVIKGEEYVRMVAGMVLLCAVTWLWLKAVRRR